MRPLPEGESASFFFENRFARIGIQRLHKQIRNLRCSQRGTLFNDCEAIAVGHDYGPPVLLDLNQQHDVASLRRGTDPRHKVQSLDAFGASPRSFERRRRSCGSNLGGHGKAKHQYDQSSRSDPRLVAIPQRAVAHGAPSSGTMSSDAPCPTTFHFTRPSPGAIARAAGSNGASRMASFATAARLGHPSRADLPWV